jgi:Tfp pilus assembly protein PilN
VSQVNLLPPELRQRQAVRRTTSLVVAAGLAVLALIGAFYFLQTQRLAGAQDDLAAQEAVNAQLQTQIADLQPYADLQGELAAKEQLVATLFVNEVSWSSALLDISRVIPDAQYLTNLDGRLSVVTAGAAASPTAAAPDSTLIGSMSFAGVAKETETIATWLTRLDEIRGWVNAWAASSQESSAFSGIYTFSSGLDLTGEAVTDRGQGGVQP